ncbi:protoheme IX farnesyltransferase [Paracoccidioides brasiliensis Pb18]|uniref:Protoheme IX farnesyltransferase, mitochondrial n=1 Tax=Paracoccidioides brasiliensis (strain Pb18) TaxID=502780 RepID=C1G7D1_PARBD|nr:protoheme IX farnesyltransferase [Paracoccidioides brasiliensis Pb18]EEH46988.1 protoheme IX farnesyltransferase [Paracoccidioides brasiliensis Pb18]
MAFSLLMLRTGVALDAAALCSRCFTRLISQPADVSRRGFSTTRVLQNTEYRATNLPKAFQKAYLSSSGLRSSSLSQRGVIQRLRKESQHTDRSALFHSVPPSIDTQCSFGTPIEANRKHGSPATSPEELPHRRRQRLKVEQEANSKYEIRPDASARLSTISSSLPKTSLRRTMATFLALTKPNLSFLVVLTATTAYGLYPIPTLLALDPSVTPLPALSTSTLTFLYLTTGTFLSSASANTLNMLFEPQHDARMSRTRNRPLVRKLLSPKAALLFAALTGTVGITALYMGTNPTVAALSAFNLFLYAFVYTPLKRISPINTWVGAIVGGIPPLMGWIAATGQSATTGHDTWRDLLFGPDSPGGWLMAAILFAWQFPHFNSLSHTIREEYKNAGYKMLAWMNPARNGRVALRYSILMFPLCAGLWWAGVVDKGFLIGGTLVNCWLAKEAYRFWKLQGAGGSARGLFWASVWHLPLLMVGTLITKKGIWDGVWRRVFGEDEEEMENEEFEQDEMEEEDNVPADASLPMKPIP